MGVGRKTELSLRRDFLNKLEEVLNNDIIILEEISVPKEFIIGKRKRNQIDIILLRKSMTISKGSSVKWQSGAVIAIIETKGVKVSAERGITQVLSYNQYFEAEFVFSTNYKKLISIPTVCDKFAFEVNEFPDIESLVIHISTLISGEYRIEPYRLDLATLQDLFQDINSEVSSLFEDQDFERLESIGFLYARNLDTEAIKTEEELETYQNSLRFTSAHILLTQLLFYRTLQQKAPRLGLNPLTRINKLSNLLDRFNEVLKINYESIFALNVLSLLKEEPNTITLINLVLKILIELKIENVRQDLLGFLLQRLIPPNYRRKIAAFYTKLRPARLLANLSINTSKLTVFDPACGSGGLLVASYHRRQQLDPKISHQELLNSSFGSDISPFACLLTTVNLAMQAPVEFTTACNIALSDAFELDHSKTLLDIVGLAKEIRLTSLSDINPVIKGYKLPKVDLLIGNPPFTYGDRMSRNYKEYLDRRFSGWGFSVRTLIDKKHLGLHGYFLLDAKRHLHNRGTFAFILPYSTLYTESAEPIVNYIRCNFGIRYIIKSEVEPAFSDSTFEEIMLIASRDYNESLKIIVLKEALDEKNLEEINRLAVSIASSKKDVNQKDYRLILIDQSELDGQKWTVFFRSKEFVDLWRTIKRKTTSINEISETIRGNRVAPINLFGLPNRNWEIRETTKTYVHIKKRSDQKTTIKFKYKMLYRSMKRYNEMAHYKAIVPNGEPNTFYIKKNETNPIYKRWVKLNKSEMDKPLYPPIDRTTYLVIPQKIGLFTTKTLAFYSRRPLHVGDGFMSIVMNPELSFFYFCYLISSFGIFNILAILRVISGGYGQILGPDMQYFRAPDFSSISNTYSEGLRNLANEICDFPVRNKTTFLEAIESAKENKNDPLFKLDILIADIMGLSKSFVNELHETLILELKMFQ